MTVSERALAIAAEGDAPTVEALGGRDVVTAALSDTTGPAVPLLVAALLAEWQIGDPFAPVVAAIANESDPLAYEELIDAVIASAAIDEAAGALQTEALSRFARREDDRTAGIAAIAIDTAVRMVLLGEVAPWELYAALSNLNGDAPSHLLIAVVRRLGALYVHDPGARPLVRQLLPTLAPNIDIGADVAFCSAYADLVDGLEAEDEATAGTHLRSARAGFAKAVSLDQNRADAELHRAALDALLGLVDRHTPAELATHAQEIRDLALLRRAWQATGRLGWLGDPLDADREWWALGQAVAIAGEAVTQTVWMEPPLIMAQMARALEATTTVRVLPGGTPAPGATRVIAPSLRQPFATDASKKALLRQWAQEVTAEDRAARKALLDTVEVERPDNASAALATRLAREFGDETLADALTAEQQLRLVTRLDAFDNTLEAENPQVRRALDDLRAGLAENVDYVAETRNAFDMIVLRTLRFVADRMNIQLSSSRVAYLTKAEAKEEALQHDYQEWMVGNGLQGIVDIEVPHVGSGRIDVRFAFGTRRIVTEVKRDKDPFGDGALDKYLNQAGAYQVSNVRLGILLVLDLSPKPQGQVMSLEKSIWLATKPALAPDDLERHIVVAVVPGNRPRSPSKLKA
ncbi:MAG: hypothetical protein AB7G37_05045 [Solirubrobacteraceae bacterium]